MADLEIHHEAEHAIDPAGQKIGVLAAVLAVALAVVTIESHRTHTEAIVLKTEANDKWQFYQSKRLKFHNLELGEDLIALLATKSAASETAIKRYQSEKDRYDREGKEVSEQAQEKENEARHAEVKALRFDFGEGLLEIGLVLTSLYFISRKKLFPRIGIVAGGLGLAIAVSGWLLK
jgi:hypothetical protein